MDLNLEIERVCPECHRRLVMLAIVSTGSVIHAWACDCEHRDSVYAPNHLVADIMRAREWDNGGVVVNLG